LNHFFKLIIIIISFSTVSTRSYCPVPLLTPDRPQILARAATLRVCPLRVCIDQDTLQSLQQYITEYNTAAAAIADADAPQPQPQPEEEKQQSAQGAPLFCTK